MEIVSAKHLVKDYGHHKGIFDVSLSIQSGEIFGFLGPNGAGKTTTILNLMGFINHDQGNCEIFGMDCRHERDSIQKRVGYLPGEITLMSDMDAKSFIHFIAEMKQMESMERAYALVDRFELDLRGKINKMSKGMKQKVGIICAFMHDPELYILDEPTSGLDPLMQKNFIDLLLEEKARGKTILMSSHIFEEVEKTCDRVAIIREGKIVTTKDIHELKGELKNHYTIEFASEQDVEHFSQHYPVVSRDGTHGVVVSVTQDMNDLIQVLVNYNVVKMSRDDLNLEKLFMNYYGGEEHDSTTL